MRIAAPFAGVPLLLATLLVSVDLIEYKPQAPREKLTTRPMPQAAIDSRREQLRREAIAIAAQPHQAEFEPGAPGVVGADPIQLDLEASPPLPRPPSRSYAPVDR